MAKRNELHRMALPVFHPYNLYALLCCPSPFFAILSGCCHSTPFLVIRAILGCFLPFFGVRHSLQFFGVYNYLPFFAIHLYSLLFFAVSYHSSPLFTNHPSLLRFDISCHSLPFFTFLHLSSPFFNVNCFYPP